MTILELIKKLKEDESRCAESAFVQRWYDQLHSRFISDIENAYYELDGIFFGLRMMGYIDCKQERELCYEAGQILLSSFDDKEDCDE